jgi:hypothetical protein
MLNPLQRTLALCSTQLSSTTRLRWPPKSLPPEEPWRKSNPKPNLLVGDIDILHRIHASPSTPATQRLPEVEGSWWIRQGNGDRLEIALSLLLGRVRKKTPGRTHGKKIIMQHRRNTGQSAAPLIAFISWCCFFFLSIYKRSPLSSCNPRCTEWMKIRTAPTTDF